MSQKQVEIAKISELKERVPAYALVKDTDLVIIKHENEIEAFKKGHPQPFDRETYLGAYADTHPEDTEPYSEPALLEIMTDLNLI